MLDHNRDDDGRRAIYGPPASDGVYWSGSEI
jgi:hypothetical protein